LDQNITDKIVRLSGSLKGYTVIEIGPGPGGLTRSILKQNPAQVYVIEYDPQFLPVLDDLKNYFPTSLTILHADALTIKTSDLGNAPRMIIANLPYNIGVPLLVKWLEESASIYKMVLMFQKEVAERIIASPHSKNYGRLSVLAQWLCRVERLLDLPPSVFTP